MIKEIVVTRAAKDDNGDRITLAANGDIAIVVTLAVNGDNGDRSDFRG